MSTQPYRIPAPRPDPYGEAWARLRTRRIIRRVAVGISVYALGTLLAVELKTSELQAGVNYAMLGTGLAFGVVFLILTAVLARYLVPFVCPRCEQPFFVGLTTEIGSVKNCVNCHLAIGTPTPIAVDPADDMSQ